MAGPVTSVKKPILQGTTPRISFQIVDEDGVGFQPETLTMSIYDVVFGTPPTSTTTQTIVNSRNDVDVLASCDAGGNVELFLNADDTTIDVPAGANPLTLERRVLFTWTWDTDPVKVGKHQVNLTILPDRETEAV